MSLVSVLLNWGPAKKAPLCKDILTLPVELVLLGSHYIISRHTLAETHPGGGSQCHVQRTMQTLSKRSAVLAVV